MGFIMISEAVMIAAEQRGYEAVRLLGRPVFGTLTRSLS